MRTVWRFQPDASSPYGTQITDLCLRGDRLYYASNSEIGCLDKRSGKAIWRRGLVSAAERKISPLAPAPPKWLLSFSGSRIYALTCPTYSSPTPGICQVVACDAENGALAWRRRFDGDALHAACPAGATVLVATNRGALVALHESDGTVAWKRAIVTPEQARSQPRDICLHATDTVGVAMIGSGKLMGFQLKDGKPLWTYIAPRDASSNPIDGNTYGFALQSGIVYACPDGSELVALNAATGKKRWSWQRNGSCSPSPAPVALNDKILLGYDGPRLWRSADGHVMDWHIDAQKEMRWLDLAEPQSVLHEAGKNSILFMKGDSDPVINGTLRASQTQPYLDDLVAFDLSTGRALWRWQPEAGFRIDKLVADSDRLYVSDDNSLRAVIPGPSTQFPTTTNARRMLAQQMASALFTPRLVKTSGNTFVLAHDVDETQAELTLIRLGKDSVPVLLSRVNYLLGDDTNPSFPLDQHAFDRPLNLLVDIHSPETSVPGLLVALKSAPSSKMRAPLVKALIQLGDPRAAPQLFQFAQSAGEPEQEQEREDALCFVCRYGRQAVPQIEVTAYLQRALQNPTTPGWLHAFAMFELLNNRGTSARAAALAAFHIEKRAHLLPPNITLTRVPQSEESHYHRLSEGFPTEFEPIATCRDSSGAWWAAFYCDYLNPSPAHWSARGHVWFVQSKDGQHWTQPAFGFDGAMLGIQSGAADDMKISCSAGTLHIKALEQVYVNPDKFRTVPHHLDISIADLYRDSDGDGLPDRLEKLIGTDPHKADTNGNGLSDGEDKNPLYVEHKLTDEEAIYQAVIEGLCQLGRMSHQYADARDKLDWPSLLGSSNTPLLLSLPGGSTGIPIYGHPGVVIGRPITMPDDETQDPDAPLIRIQGKFVAPHIGLDGRWADKSLSREDVSGLAFAPRKSKLPPLARQRELFRYFFPVVISHDGMRARVGWTGDSLLYGAQSMGSSTGFDIEVRKIEGHWYPVECRPVFWAWRMGSTQITIPVTPGSQSGTLARNW
jgi:outer membrane protein assembly factor BamB